MASVPRLKYNIVKCSSEDPEYPVSGLLVPHSQSKGWQTARFCDFPQEMILQFETPVHLRKVEFLSHQSKIATKIELFTALPAAGQECSADQLSFKRLGYLSLDNNERSKFEARELKSVYVDVVAQCLRILFHKCHVNKYNIVNQVGLIALKCMGEVLTPDAPQVQAQVASQAVARGPVPAAVEKRPSPSPQAAAAAAESAQEAAQAAADEMQFDAATFERIRSLSQAKQRAVEAEDYEEAKRCKEMLVRLRQTGLVLRQLEDKKRSAVQNEDYDTAKALKVEIERLRNSIERPQAGGHPAARASPGDSDAEYDAGNDWQPQQMAPHRSDPPPRPFVGDEAAPGPGRPLGHSPLAHSTAPEPAPFGRQDSNSNSRARGAGGVGNHGGGYGGSPAGGYDDGYAASPAAGSPPLPAVGAGGARMLHSPAGIGQPPPWGGHGAPSPGQPPEQPAHRENFDPKHHPLAGVPNIEDLGEPEAIAFAQEKEAEQLRPLFGDYLTRCLFSKSWNLRDAALQKVVIDLNAGVFRGMHPSSLLDGLAAVLRRAIPDKNVQVFLSCGPLLHALCRGLLSSPAAPRRGEVHSALDPIMPMLVERLGDANGRVDKTARDAHLDFAQTPCIGAHFAAAQLLRPPKKKTVPPRVFTSRLQLLTSMVEEAGIAPLQQEGLDLDAVCKVAMEWFNNSNADVRESAVQLVGACQARVGNERIERYLSNLKPVQRDLFDAEFERRATGEHGQKRRDGAEGGWGDLPPPQVPPPRGAAAGGGGAAFDEAPGDADDCVCQFCLRQDPTFTPETVDVHYWRECPMLIQCELCQQVIEVATLHEHFAQECEAGASARTRARQIPVGGCPLCGVAVGAGEDKDWRDHLLRDGCRKNPRDANRRSCAAY